MAHLGFNISFQILTLIHEIRRREFISNQSLSVSICFCICVSVCLSLSFCVCVSVFVSVSGCLLSLSLYLYLSVSVSPTISKPPFLVTGSSKYIYLRLL